MARVKQMPTAAPAIMWPGFSKERNLVTFQLNCRRPLNSLSTLGPPKHLV